MRKLILTLMMLAIVAGPVMAGDPLDTNDSPKATTDVDYYCTDFDMDGFSAFEAWQCGLALQDSYGGWWEWGW